MTIQPLIEVLTRIYDCQVKLLELTVKKKDVIIQDRTDELSKLTNQESRIVKQLSELDAQRTEALREYLAGLGLTPDAGITLSELTKRVVQAKEKSELLALQAQLSDVTSRLKQMNKTNSELIQSSLAYIEFSLELFTGSDSNDMTYRNPSGTKRVVKSPGIFDSRA